jgi:murein DD-endopeptidase MepM/ murein hydrolase activator NlpD
MTSLETIKLAWPVRDHSGNRLGRITQEYRPPSHMGVDIAVPGHYQDAAGSVVAIAAGKVAAAYLAPRGWSVLLDHGDWASGYLHLAELDPAVREGGRVELGQRLGPMGADPLDAEHVVHLHLQLAPGGHTADPAPYLARAV